MPPRDFHSTPASTRASRTPQAGEFSARAAIAPGDSFVAGAWNWANTRLPAPRQVSARVQIQSAVPLLSGSACWANRQSLTVRTPCERTVSSRQAVRAQPSRAERSPTSRVSEGGPQVSRAGASSPRSLKPHPAVVAELQRLPRRTGPRLRGRDDRIGHPVPVPVQRARVASGVSRSRTEASRTQGAVR